jgi:hypothetical protein
MWVLRLRAFSLQPTVWRRGKQLAATSSWLQRLLTLGAYARTVHVDGEARYVYLHARRFWLFVRSRVVPFTAIARVHYEFGALPTSGDRSGRAHDTIEAFRVTLVLHADEERVPLVTFYGSGAAGDLVTLAYGDSLVELEGTQEDDSRRFVTQLCELTGVSLSRPLPRVPDVQGRIWRCAQCARPVPPRPRCQYCGGQPAPEPDLARK